MCPPDKYIKEILAGFLPIQKIGFCLYVMCRNSQMLITYPKPMWMVGIPPRQEFNPKTLNVGFYMI
jgi:hypothetical protein